MGLGARVAAEEWRQLEFLSLPVTAPPGGGEDDQSFVSTPVSQPPPTPPVEHIVAFSGAPQLQV